MGGMYNISDETRTILANSYLELQQIRENTGEIVKPIKQMQKDMEEVKRTHQDYESELLINEKDAWLHGVYVWGKDFLIQ